MEMTHDVGSRLLTSPQSVGPRGVADASLYRRMRKAGFMALSCFLSWTFDSPDGPIRRYREDHVLSQSSEAETSERRDAIVAARAEGLLLMTNPMHRAVGVKPRGRPDAASPKAKPGLHLFLHS